MQRAAVIGPEMLFDEDALVSPRPITTVALLCMGGLTAPGSSACPKLRRWGYRSWIRDPRNLLQDMLAKAGMAAATVSGEPIRPIGGIEMASSARPRAAQVER